ncbi:MAG: polysaccharide biosynthesis tyrosine autokinase [Desulfobacterales bacterium]|nr:polysaccharide biosynthesis tyrosine autokinase [Desulfobacterales bacterium]
MEQNTELQAQLKNYLRVIIKRKWTIISALVLVLLITAVKVFTTVPMYHAQARMLIEKTGPNIVSFQDVMASDRGGGAEYYQTQYKIIASRAVAREVIRRLQLDQSDEFKATPSNNPLRKTWGAVTSSLTGWGNKILSLLQTKAPLSTSTAAPVVAETDEKTTSAADIGLVNAFISRISVRPVAKSRLVDIGFTAKDPVLATKIVNTLVQAYIDHNLETRLQTIKGAMVWINDRIAKERQRVEEAEKALQQYRVENSIITEFSGDIETVMAEKMAELNNQIVEAESRRVEAETKYRKAMQMKNNPLLADSIPELLDSRLIQQLKGAEVELIQEISQLSKKYGPEHPRMKAIRAQIETLKGPKQAEIQRVLESLKNDYEVALARENSLRASYVQQQQETMELSRKAVQYGFLKREMEGAREMYNILIKRFKEASVVEDIEATNIRIIDKAEGRGYMVIPNTKKDLQKGALAGLMLGLALAFLFEYLDNTFKAPDEIEQYLEVPYLGLVPSLAKDEQDGTPELITTSDHKSPTSECYRSIRTKILFSSAEEAPKTIMFTSATAKEGKTITSANLAVTMAQAGSRVILIDCDMRRPRIHNIMNVSRDKGMSNALVGNCTLEEVIIPSSVPNLDVIPAGPIPPNPSELLGSKAMTRLLAELGEKYDRIIIDTPPISAVTDPVVMAKFVDGVILVVHTNVTRREIVRDALSSLKMTQAHVLGAVLNNVDMARNAYYYQYYYHYGYYYSEDGDKKGKRRDRQKRRKRSTTPMPHLVDTSQDSEPDQKV